VSRPAPADRIGPTESGHTVCTKNRRPTEPGHSVSGWRGRPTESGHSVPCPGCLRRLLQRAPAKFGADKVVVRQLSQPLSNLRPLCTNSADARRRHQRVCRRPLRVSAVRKSDDANVGRVPLSADRIRAEIVGRPNRASVSTWPRHTMNRFRRPTVPRGHSVTRFGRPTILPILREKHTAGPARVRAGGTAGRDNGGRVGGHAVARFGRPTILPSTNFGRPWWRLVGTFAHPSSRGSIP
jgi:hypothetical protein